MKKFIIAETLFLSFLLLLILVQLLGISWSKETLTTTCQPDDVHYASYDPYCVSINRVQQSFDSQYFILVAKKAEPAYGFVLNYPAPYGISKKDAQDMKVTWTNDGIEIQAYTNTKISIPKKNFIGGR